MTESARRDVILETAAAVFGAGGYVGTSLKDVADACGIQAGSLYHHFDSKEAIIIELVQAYQTELDGIGTAALQALETGTSPPIYDNIILLSTSIAGCAVRHRAAMQLTSYEAPAGASEQLIELVAHRPQAVNHAMAAILERGQAERQIRADVDASVLAEQLTDTMHHVALGVLHRDANTPRVAATLCHLVLDGVAVHPFSDDELDRSSAMQAAAAIVSTWDERPSEPDGKATQLLAAARTEFARRGYQATTVRDIAAAAGMATGTVYRFIESKQALLTSIMSSFHSRLSDGYDAVIASDATTVQKLDALTWLNINILESSSEEFAIQRSWLRAVPPAATDLDTLQLERVRQIQSVVAEGLALGQLRAGQMGTGPMTAPAPPIDVLAMCFRDLMWLSSIVRQAGRRGTLTHWRATFLRGAAARP